MIPFVLVISLLIPTSFSAEPGGRVEQRVIAWSEDGAVALIVMETLAEELDLVADGESAAAAALLALAALRCDPEVWAAARRFVTDRGIPVEERVRLLGGCDPHVGNEDADFVMALATSDDLPLELRVAAGRILGRMRGETPNRLKGKLWRFKPPKEVMDAIQGKR